MRLAPVPMFFAADPRAAVERAADSSRTTHGAATAVDACRYLAGLILGALAGAAKDELLAPRYSPVPGLWEEQPLAPEVDEVAAGSFLRREPPEIKGSGYVVRSLEAALWAFARGGSFREGALLAVEPRRRRRHDRSRLRAARRRLLRRGGDPRGVEVEARAPRDDRGARRSAARGGRLIEQPALAGYPSDPYRLRPRLTTRLTLPPPDNTVPGSGFCEITRPLLTFE